MIVLSWFAAAVGLIFVRQFFREVRWTARIPWGVLTLATVGMVAYSVSNKPREAVLNVLFRITTAGAMASILWFIWRYSRMEPWWRHAIGNTIVLKDVALLILLAFLGAGLLGFQVTPWASLFFLAILAPLMIWRTEVWQRIHDAPKTSGDAEKAADADV